ncbi:PhnA protein [Marinobacterium jannaschii]|uniref:PhnA protein n=1 Tax=Marinobacterium jannaschii TaxID=64970 RepID=UPI00047F46E2|nr:PhnA protein [Marinobacterium jannaschii]
MARGHSRHGAHHNLNHFGKELVRRCSAHCELCDAQGVKLKIYEVPPIPADAMLDHCIMICETCYEQIEKPKRLDADHWRCLYNSIWNDTPAVKVAALAMLDQVAEREAWAAELREQAYMEPEEEAWLEELEAL